MNSNEPVRIYFLGSGKLGRPVLDALATDPRVELCGVGSQPDKPVGRKQIITPTALACHALSRGIPVDRLSSVNAEGFLADLREKQVEILLVVAFGQLLKEPLLALPSCCCLNVHASLLPRYRGACPINSAILNGDSETGVAFMQMDKGLDTGAVYETVKLPILPDDDTETLEARLAVLAGQHIVDICWKVAREGLQAVPQTEATMPSVRKISKKDACIDWHCEAERLSRMVRAYIPWPHVRALVPDPDGKLKQMQILQASVVEGDSAARPGQVLEAKKALTVACGAGALRITQIIPEGKKEMDAAAFLRGNPLPLGTILPDFPRL